MKVQFYDNFRQQMHKTAKTKGFPLRVMFELTYRCNFQCRHCYVPFSYRKLEELKTREVFCILDQLADIGCFYLGFTGGEPFMRKDFLQILWYTKRKGFQIIVYTNGSLINKEIADELSRIRLNKVDITIPAMKKTAFEHISGVAGSRDKVFSAINLLYKRKVSLGFKTCVLKQNEAEIKDIQKFANSLGVLHRFDDMLLPRIDGSKEPYKYRGKISIVKTKKEPRVPRECVLNSELRTLNSEQLFKCGVGISQAAITPQGELKMCLMIDYPKFKILNTRVTRSPFDCARGKQGHEVTSPKENLRDAWHRLKSIVDNIKLDGKYRCDKYVLQPYCTWCPARGWLENRNFGFCSSEMRQQAEIRKKAMKKDEHSANLFL